MGRPPMAEATNTASQLCPIASSPIMKAVRGRGRGNASRGGVNARSPRLALKLKVPAVPASPTNQKEESHTAIQTAIQSDAGNLSPGGPVAKMWAQRAASTAVTTAEEKNGTMVVCPGGGGVGNEGPEIAVSDIAQGAAIDVLSINRDQACPAYLAPPQEEVKVAEKVESTAAGVQTVNGEAGKKTPVKTPTRGAGKSTRGRGGGRGRGRGRGRGQETAKNAPPLGEVDGMRQTTMVEHFDIRKSTRRPALQAKKETQQVIQDKIRNRAEEGLMETFEEGKGRGVRATDTFQRGDFVCEYYGDLIDRKEAAAREQMYAADPSYGCYMYYITHNNKSWCVDATMTSGLGRLINHGKSQANLVSRVVEVDGLPRLSFFARDTVHPGTELLYDYGDRRKDAVKVYPWLAQ